MRRLAQNALRFLLAGVLLFVTLAMARAIVQLFTGSSLPRDVLPALLGAAGTVGLFCLDFRFGWVYTFRHELSHWLAAKAFRRRTSSFRIGPNGGSVRVERPNIFIVLCPYVVPFLSLAWVGLFGVCLAILGTVPDGVEFAFEIGLGATYAFHVLWTVWTLRIGQTDMRIFGRTLSISVVLLGNTAILLLALMVASRRWSFAMSMLGSNLGDQWSGLAHGVVATVRFVHRLFSGAPENGIDPASWVATLLTNP
jgi:hypothetical protein